MKTPPPPPPPLAPLPMPPPVTNLTIYGLVDLDLQRTIEYLRNRGVGVTVSNHQPSKDMEKAKSIERATNDAKSNTSSKHTSRIALQETSANVTVFTNQHSKGKENMCPLGNAKRKASYAEKGKAKVNNRSLAQQKRRERERLKGVLPPLVIRENDGESTRITSQVATKELPQENACPLGKEPINADCLEKGKASMVITNERNGTTFEETPLRSHQGTIDQMGILQAIEGESINNTITISKRSLGQQLRRKREMLERLQNPTAPKRSMNMHADITPSIDPTSHPQHYQRVNLHTLIAPRNIGEKFQSMGRDTSMAGTSALVGASFVLQHELPIITEENPDTDDNDTDDEAELIHEDETELMPEMVIQNFPVNMEGRHFLGKMDVLCPYCSAYHWDDERLANSSKRNPFFGTCCLQGKVSLPLLLTPPPTLQTLFDGTDRLSKSFRQYTREYNAANAFTSLGSTMEPRTLNGRGPTSFIIHGELRHRTGSLIPEPNREATYSQLYIYDSSSALDIRCRRDPRLDRDVLKIIQENLESFNPFPQKYRHAHEILNHANPSQPNLPAYLHYNSSKDRRRYNLPSAEEIAVILPGDGSEISGMRDIIVYLRGNNKLQRISECHPAYLPLHYVLLFPYGELGWEPGILLLNGSTEEKRLTQMQFYSYRIFQRSTEYSSILRAKRLFQEFLVDAWAATEQNRLKYCRNHQNKLRCDLYSGLTDVGVEGLGLDQVGQRFILPSSFTGSPRNMFEIYQDSMAITRIQ